MKFYGIDLHTDMFQVTGIDLSREDLNKTRKKYSIEKIGEFLEGLSKDDYIAIEATGNSFWFYDQVISRVKDCYVLDTNKITFKGNKTDHLDSEKILDVLTYFVLTKGKDKIPSVYVPKKEVREIRSLFSTYSLLKKEYTQTVNRIHSLCVQEGKKISRDSIKTKAGRTLLEGLEFSEITKYQINLLLNIADTIEAKKEEMKDFIIVRGHQVFKKEVDLLITIKGISLFIAVGFMADVVDINRFSSVKKLCSYLRTAPKIKESNKKSYIGAVNKISRSLTCTLMTQSITHIKTASPYFTSFYTKLRNKKSIGKCRVALIRKTISVAFYLLTRNQEFKWKKEDNVQKKHDELIRAEKRVYLLKNILKKVA